MISYFFRLLLVALKGTAGPPAPLTETSVLFLRAWPWDLDTNGHLNNGRYLTWMDFGRLYLAARGSWFWAVVRRRAQPLVARSALRHFKPVPAFGKARLETTLVAWDEKWLFFEHRIFYKEELAAHGMVKALIAGRQGPIPSAETLAWAGHTGASPKIPVAFKAWVDSEQALIKALKAEKAGK